MSKKKGDVLEKIVAELHSVPGVHVSRNVRLKTSTGKQGGRGREIDVLVEANVAGYEVQIAIECKNEREKIGAPKIDGFAGKLSEVGIPTRHGIFISTSGFTAGALQSATAHRIRTLVLSGLSVTGLLDDIGKALCSTVYLLCDVLSVEIENKAPSASLSELNILYVDGKFDGFVLDRFARLWIQEQIPSNLGKHLVELPRMNDAYQVVEGEKVEILRVTAEVEVIGLVLQIGGSAVQHALIDPLTQSVHRLRATVIPSAPPSSGLPLVFVRTEGDVQRLCTSSDATNFVLRVRLPRIRFGPAYWPLSRRAMTKMKQAALAHQRGEGPDPADLTLRDIEGDDLAENFRV